MSAVQSDIKRFTACLLLGFAFMVQAVIASAYPNPSLTPLPALQPTDTYSTVFPDPLFAQRVAAAAGKTVGDIVQQADLDTVLALIMGTQDITDLSGIGHLRKLRNFQLENARHLTVIPAEVGYLADLQRWVLWHAPITAVPPEVGYWSQLTTISFWGCDEVTFPPQIANWASLTYIDFDGDFNGTHPRGEIAVIPSQMGEIVSLQAVQLQNNKIERLPATFANLTALTSLDLSNNRLLYPLPVLPPIAYNTSNQVATWQAFSQTVGQPFSADVLMPPILLQLKNDFNAGTLAGQGSWVITKPDASTVTVAGGDGSESAGVFDQVGAYTVTFTVANGNNQRLNGSVYTIPVLIRAAPSALPVPTLSAPVLLGLMALVLMVGWRLSSRRR